MFPCLLSHIWYFPVIIARSNGMSLHPFFVQIEFHHGNWSHWMQLIHNPLNLHWEISDPDFQLHLLWFQNLLQNLVRYMNSLAPVTINICGLWMQCSALSHEYHIFMYSSPLSLSFTYLSWCYLYQDYGSPQLNQAKPSHFQNHNRLEGYLLIHASHHHQTLHSISSTGQQENQEKTLMLEVLTKSLLKESLNQLLVVADYLELR